jgi:PAS domain S-box-containing protein
VSSPSTLRTASRRALAELTQARDVRLSRGRAVIAGAALGALAVLVKSVMEQAAADPGFIILMASIIAAAWVGGIPGGIAALATTALLHGFLLLFDPFGWASPASSAELFKEVFYVVIGAATVVLVGSRRASHDRLADALADTATLAAALEARDQRLELVLAASGTGIWEWDVASGELEWSETIFQQHGLDPAGTPPDFDTYLQTIHPDDRAAFRDAIAEVVAQGGLFGLEFRIVWPDGSVHWTHGSGRLFRDRTGRPVRMVGTGQDITERRRLEEERDRLVEEERRAGEFREAFVDVISHELRTPITTILGLAQILARPGRQDDPAARAALLADVRAESERLHRLVEDLLVLSRVEHGRLIVETEPIEPRRLIERIVTWAAAEHPDIVIGLEVGRHLPVVAGEATYVEQIVRNLLDNAAKYSPAGTAVTVSAHHDGDAVVFRVVDEGPGIPEASTQRLFDLFYRDPELARTASGSGIGLFVCASLVHAMGGRIWAQRRPEGGSEFGFTLRVMNADDDTPIPEGSTSSAEPATDPSPPAAGSLP